jgi:hypothetical protein
LIYCLPRSRQDERSLHQNWQGPKCCLCLSPSMYCNAYTQQKMWTMTTLSSVFLKHDNWNPPLTMTAQGIALTLANHIRCQRNYVSKWRHSHCKWDVWESSKSFSPFWQLMWLAW